VAQGIKHLGIDHINYCCATTPGNAKHEDPLRINREMLDYARSAGLDYSLAAQVLDPPDQAVRDAVAAHDEHARFEGMLFDEVEHWRLMYPNQAVPLVDNASLLTLEQAYDASLGSFNALRARFEALGVRQSVATLFWPDLHHLTARAGFTVCPKICKELYSPVSLAVGMGAALQYGRRLWADVDLWYWTAVPGHPSEEVRSNLLLAYWAGVDRAYLEGAGYNLWPAGAAGIPFSLMSQIKADRFVLTPIGEVVRWFCREYVPAHPRPWTFADLEPTIAIVRFPDSCHGQRFSAISAPGEAWGERLYGSPHLRSTPDTEAWFGLWNLLTHGATGHDGLTHFKSSIACKDPVGFEPQSTYATPEARCDTHTFFTPLNNAVVFDHLVEHERLRDIPLIFLTGVAVSERTVEALRRCADDGATVIAWGPLARRSGLLDWIAGTSRQAQGRGQIVATDEFSSIDAARFAAPHLGRADEIRYRFRDRQASVTHEVVVTRIDENRVSVETTRSPIAG
jgi:hypothetical protein